MLSVFGSCQCVWTLLSEWLFCTSVACFIAICKSILLEKPSLLFYSKRKSGNLLVDDNWRVSVVDFGISRMIDLSMSKKNIGTPIYSAPEVLCGKPYSFSADVYSFSFVIWELLSRQVPYKVQSFRNSFFLFNLFFFAAKESQASFHHQRRLQRQHASS